jgi:37-kD nucleoid-associated bacterial protein
MIDASLASVQKLIVHRVGNKLREEAMVLSDEESTRSERLDALLMAKFLEPMVQKGQICELHHETELSLNQVYRTARAIFDDPDSFATLTRALANHLYAVSTHPKIGGGELLIVLWDGLAVDEVPRQALGIFKVEEISDFLEVVGTDQQIEITEKQGIALHQIQKGALVLAGGQRVQVIDNLGKSTQYWMENFLKAAPCESARSSAQAAGSFLKAVAKKIDSPERALNLAKQVRENLDDTEDLSFGDLKKISAAFVEAKELDAIATKVQNKLGYPLAESTPFKSSDLARYSKDVTSRARIMDGVSLVIAGPKVEVTHITVQNNSNRVTATIELQVNE